MIFEKQLALSDNICFRDVSNGWEGAVSQKTKTLLGHSMEGNMIKCNLRLALAVALCLLAFSGILRGQGSVGTLNGTILDAQGAVVPGATVVATNQATSVESQTTTTSAGAYTLPYLPSGTYNIKVSAPGFRTATAENVILRVAQTMTVNITLEVGQITEQVTVSAAPPLLESGTAEIGRYIAVEEYKSWPIFLDDGQRQIQSFIFTSLPGTTGGTFKGSINGGQEYSHEILIEGIPVGRSDLSGGNNTEMSPSAEAIGEFKLQAGAVSAQYNGGQTAVANFSIKSGTNELHGSAFYYGENEALFAKNLSEKTRGVKKKNPYRDNDYGYSVGGPVYIPKIYDGRNKTFFFTNFEKDKRKELRLSGFRTVTPMSFREGDFSRLFDPSWTGNSASGTEIGTDALGRPIIFGAIYDPKSTRIGPDGSPIRDPFIGNQIPKSLWDPVAVNIVDKVGLVPPSFDKMINNIERAAGQPGFRLHIIGIKGDHNVTEKHRISGYYNHSYRGRNNNGGSPYLPVPGPPTSSWQDQFTPARMVRLSLNSTISPTVLNRVAAGYNRFRNTNGALQRDIDKDWAGQIGIQNTSPTQFPTMNFSGQEFQGGRIARMGVGFTSNDSFNGSWVAMDDLTWISGKHSFRFGYEYKNYFYTDRNRNGSGNFTFSPRQTDLPGYFTQTGHSFASFLLGAVNNASRNIVGLNPGFRQPQHSLYVMDDFKMTPKLTLNLGLRWEIIPPFYEVTGRMSEVDLTVPNPGAGGKLGALVFGKQFNDTYWKMIGPRLGFAYQVNDKMVVRGGYAMTNNPPIRNDWGYGGFTYGYNGNIPVLEGTSPTGFRDDPAMYLSDRFPDPKGTLPNTDPAVANFDWVTTTARDANRPGYVQNWNLTIQYQLPQDAVLELAYIANKGTRLHAGCCGANELNTLPASLLVHGDILNQLVGDHPTLKPYPDFPDDQSVAQALRRYPQYGSVQEAFPYWSNSNYNALQVTVTRHLTKGLGFLAAYTWSKTLGYVDSNGAGAYYAYLEVQDYFNRKLDRSVTSFNYPHSLKVTWVYELPVGKGRRWDLGWANYVLGGWQLAAIHNFRSGDPLGVRQSGLAFPAGFAQGIRPDVTGANPTTGSMPSKADWSVAVPYLNQAAWAESPRTPDGTPLRVGTAPRYSGNLRGPHSVGEDMRLSKRFTIYERMFFQLGFAMTNPFNRTYRYWASTNVSDSEFGMLYQGGGGKTVQLEGRIEW